MYRDRAINFPLFYLFFSHCSSIMIKLPPAPVASKRKPGIWQGYQNNDNGDFFVDDGYPLEDLPPLCEVAHNAAGIAQRVKDPYCEAMISYRSQQHREYQ